MRNACGSSSDWRQESTGTHAIILVKTIYGVSADSYSGTALEPLCGTDQGSTRASPVVWLSLVFILLNTLEPVVPKRISFKSADGTIQHHRLVDAFVDNAAIGLMDTGELSWPELVAAFSGITMGTIVTFLWGCIASIKVFLVHLF